jgi:hypothetical protein
VQWIEYGSPLRSGYPAMSSMFRLEHVLPNLAHYPAWLLESQTPLVLLAVAAPWVVRRGPSGADRARAGIAWTSLAIFAVLFATYLLYPPFDDWSFLRFLLPAVPLLVALASAVVVAAIRRGVPAASVPAVVLVLSLLVAASAADAVREGVFLLQRMERKYEATGSWVATHVPARAAVFTLQHSGSLRFYSDRLTVRWDAVPPEWFDRAVRFFADRGYPPYLLLEQGEVDPFQRRFRDRSRYAALSWLPIGKIGQVRVYALPADPIAP